MNEALLHSVTAILNRIPDDTIQNDLNVVTFDNPDGDIAGVLIQSGSNTDRAVLIDALVRAGFSSPKDWSLKEINEKMPWESYPDLFVFLGSFQIVRGQRKDDHSDIPAPQDSVAIEIR